jgi:AcrR family transcriptional regulator
MGTRTYLRPPERRRQLLDAASRLLDRGGFGAITMVAVAQEAGASRRLVYDHFADLAELCEALFEDRAARYATAIDAAAAAADPDPDGRRLALPAVTALLAIPPADLRAIHLVLADSGTPELSGARELLRTHLLARWLPALASAGLAADVAGALLWATASSVVALADQVHRGELRRPDAERLAEAIVAALPQVVAATQTDLTSDPSTDHPTDPIPEPVP